jgi:integrase
MAFRTVSATDDSGKSALNLSPSITNKPITFADAAASYIEHGGEARYLSRIIGLLGDRPLSLIHPFDIRQAAQTLYPAHANSTLNRQAVTPIRAVMSHAYDRGWAPLMRIKRFKETRIKKAKPATVVWLHCFVTQADRDNLPHLAALVMFMSTTAARVSEAIALRWPEVNLAERTALLLKTKTGANSPRTLTDDMIARLQTLAGNGKSSDRVFRYRSRFSVNERIKAVCQRAGIPYKSSHMCGRHSFATNAIALGADLKSAMDAGDWKSVTVFVDRYVTPRQPGRRVAELFNGQAYEVGL